MNVTYLGNYYISEDKPLSEELRKITGLNFSNVLGFIYTFFQKEQIKKDIRTTTFSDLSDSQKKNLEQWIEKQVIDVNPTFSNRKPSLCSSNYISILNYDCDNPKIILGSGFSASVELAKKRLVSMGCLTGRRTKANRKVHGQRTKSTGRKTKVLKGFQKKKKNEKV